MKRIAALFLIPLILCLATPCLALNEGGITIIMSSRIKPYMLALQGFHEVYSNIQANLAQKAIQSYPYNEIYLPESSFDKAAFVERIRSDSPALLIAIGTKALESVNSIHDIPIITLLTPELEKIISGHKNISGIEMIIEPELALDTLLTALPTAKKIGFLYNPTFRQNLVNRLEAYAKKKAATLVVRQADTPKQVPRLVSELRGLINVLWVFPDPTLLTGETLEHMLLFSLENQIPLISFSEKHVQSGAALAITLDLQDIGRQAGTLTRKILSKAKTSELTIEKPRRLKIIINRGVIKILGIKLNNNIEYFEE